MSQGPDVDFWTGRYRSGQTGWDRGGASPKLQSWLDGGLLVPPARIAVPGCGRGWEVAALAKLGFEVTGIDYTAEAVDAARANLAAADVRAEIVKADVLHWQPDEPFDVIYEQTCLCALHPDHWVAYGTALSQWLRPGGLLLALFIQRAPEASEGFVVGPPYHCDIHAMRALVPATLWEWSKPPYPRVPHPHGMHELAVSLRRR